MDFRVLGPLEVTDGSDRLLGGRKQRAVLARLLLTPNSVVTLGALADASWGEDPPEQARSILQVYVANLRRLLDAAGDPEGSRIVRRAGGYELRVGIDELDLHRFERLVTQGRVALARRDFARASALLREGLALWRGVAFPDLLDGAQVPPAVYALEELRLGVIEDRLDADLAVGRIAAVVAELEALVAAHPLRERLHAQLALALYRDGRQADALQACRRVRALLRDELGIDPGPALRELEQGILHQDPILDRSAPRQISRLPRPIDEFVGRRVELGHVSWALGRHRLVTLTGTGGVGKTRLALEVGDRSVERFPDGVWFADLSTTERPEEVPALVADALQVSVRPGEDTGEAIVGALQDSAALLVLDNCEHLLAAARAFVSRAVAESSSLHVLATSRQPLRVRGEVAVPVGPLSLSSPGEVGTESDAVALFLSRARSAAPWFDPGPGGLADVAEVCRRLDGLPLAIELAAVRIAALSPRQLAQHLDERFGLLRGTDQHLPARQRTLTEVVRWSYELLPPAEQALFRRLAVFPASFSLAVAEEVVTDDMVPSEDIPRLMVELVDKSLVEAVVASDGSIRYDLLQVLQRFGQDCLEADGETARWRDRLLGWALGSVERLELHMRSPRQDALLAEARLEHHSMRGALDWAIRRGDGLTALRIASAVPLGQAAERRTLLEHLLAQVPDAPLSVLAAADLALSNLCTELGDYGAAMEAASAGIDAAASGGDRRVEAWARHYLIGAAYGARDFETVDALCTRLLDDFRRLDEPFGLAYVTWTMGTRSADPARAAAWASEAVERFRQLGAPFGLAHALEGQGIVALRADEPARAARSIAEAVHLFAASGNAGCTAHALETAAACIARLPVGAVGAAEVAGAAEALRAQSGQALRPWEIDTHEQVAALLRGTDEGVRAAHERGALHSLASAADVAQRFLSRPSPDHDARVHAGRPS